MPSLTAENSKFKLKYRITYVSERVYVFFSSFSLLCYSFWKGFSRRCCYCCLLLVLLLSRYNRFIYWIFLRLCLSFLLSFLLRRRRIRTRKKSVCSDCLEYYRYIYTVHIYSICARCEPIFFLLSQLHKHTHTHTHDARVFIYIIYLLLLFTNVSLSFFIV